jgi:hypothetical protein
MLRARVTLELRLRVGLIARGYSKGGPIARVELGVRLRARVALGL